jgi:hypothetical protein
MRRPTEAYHSTTAQSRAERCGRDSPPAETRPTAKLIAMPNTYRYAFWTWRGAGLPLTTVSFHTPAAAVRSTEKVMSEAEKSVVPLLVSLPGSCDCCPAWTISTPSS